MPWPMAAQHLKRTENAAAATAAATAEELMRMEFIKERGIYAWPVACSPGCIALYLPACLPACHQLHLHRRVWFGEKMLCAQRGHSPLRVSALNPRAFDV